ncbi:hypothetical protein AB3662_44690 [Sorangium cellulosum]|uniref:hypothetical protein n=1 Tax=Sorangium cellulosum TaxID=56 RepID=UPI003D9A377B
MPEIQAEQPIGMSIMRVKRPGSPAVSMAEIPIVLDPTGSSIGASVSVTPWRAMALSSERLGPSLDHSQVAEIGARNVTDISQVRPMRKILASDFDGWWTMFKTLAISAAGIKNVQADAGGFSLAVNTDLWNHRDPRTYTKMAQCITRAFYEWIDAKESHKSSETNPIITDCEDDYDDVFGVGIRAGFFELDGTPKLNDLNAWAAWDIEFHGLAWTLYGDFGRGPVVDDRQSTSGRLGGRVTIGSTTASISVQVTATVFGAEGKARLGTEPALLLHSTMIQGFPATAGVRLMMTPDFRSGNSDWLIQPHFVASLGWADLRGSARSYLQKLKDEYLKEEQQANAASISKVPGHP